MRKMPTTHQIDELQKMIDNGGGSGGSGVFIATYGTTTLSQIQAADAEGKFIVAKISQRDLGRETSGDIIAILCAKDTNYFGFRYIYNGTIEAGDYTHYNFQLAWDIENTTGVL